MAELTDKEYWFIQVYFKNRGFLGSHSITDIRLYMRSLSCWDTDQIIDALTRKNVFSMSPDKRKIKFTDYGIELFASMSNQQKHWEEQPIIKVTNLDRDQILIRAGETFEANRVLREIVSQAQKELYILDPYIGTNLFDLVQDTDPSINTRIVTSDRIQKKVIQAYCAFKQQYASVEMRSLEYGKIHDRFILLDKSKGFHIGHSLKDLGTRDTQLTVLKNPQEQLKLFEQRWAEAQPIV